MRKLVALALLLMTLAGAWSCGSCHSDEVLPDAPGGGDGDGD